MMTVATPAARWSLGGALVLWAGLSCVPLPRPAPVPASGLATEFSAERAMVHVRSIAQKPHPLQSAEHDRVRDYILGEFRKQGLEPELVAGHSELDFGKFHAEGDVENIRATLPGRDPSPGPRRPVVLMAHYDSTPKGPGAGDDASGVAALLETLRALRSGPPLGNDIVFLITDGEEKGLLGAVLVMKQYRAPLPRLVLNFDSRGSGGPSYLFETSKGNEWMIRTLAAAVPRANATSMAYEVYRRMPNNTDLTIFKRAGLAGMNFGFIGHVENYHTATDTPENLDPRSLQEQGRYALGLARAFGDRKFDNTSTSDAVYFPTIVTTLIVYPAWWATYIAAGTLGALLIALWLGLGRRSQGLWIWPPLLLMSVGEILLASPTSAPGVTYLLAWPAVAGTVGLLLLVTAEREVGLGWRLAALMAAPGLVFPVVIPILAPLVTALGWKVAAPVTIAALLLMGLCCAPQMVLMRRDDRALRG